MIIEDTDATESSSYKRMSKRELIEELSAADDRIEELESAIEDLGALVSDDDAEAEEEDDDED